MEKTSFVLMDDRTPKEAVSTVLTASEIQQGDFLSEGRACGDTGLPVYTRIYKRDDWSDHKDVLYGKDRFGGDLHFLADRSYAVITEAEMEKAGYPVIQEPLFRPNLKGYERTVRFKDGEGKIVRAEVEVRIGDNSTKKNWHDLSKIEGRYATFAVCYERDGSMGQSGFVPGNKTQQVLWDLWDQYRLNDMKAGTKAQTEALASQDFKDWVEFTTKQGASDTEQKIKAHNTKIANAQKKLDEARKKARESNETKVMVPAWVAEWVKKEPKPEYKRPSDYALQNTYLELQGLSNQYKYGSAWLLNPLDEMFTTNLHLLLDEIERLERERVSEVECKFKGTMEEIVADDIDETDVPLIEEDLGEEWRRKVALASHLGLDYQGCFDIEVDEDDADEVSYSGENYLVCDNDEMETRWDDELDHYIDECILPEMPDNAKRYFDRAAWKSDAQHDGVGHSLNRHDGTHHTVTVDKTWNIFRQ